MASSAGHACIVAGAAVRFVELQHPIRPMPMHNANPIELSCMIEAKKSATVRVLTGARGAVALWFLVSVARGFDYFLTGATAVFWKL